ncbi:MAG: NUDIX domain-containing protein [Oscillospiraceae bacterium]|nr:NUDIX domain-containing protein [Oscillospiraceae bacterium]
MAELWDLYNALGEPLSETHERGKPLPDGKYHLVANILPVNTKGQILITRRHPGKNFGGMWETTGGAVISGETALEGAVRELYEETGLSAEPCELEYRGEIVRKGKYGGNTIHKFYLYRGEFTEEDVRLQEGETVDFRLCTPDEIESMTKSGEFIAHVYERNRAMYPDETKKGESK